MTTVAYGIIPDCFQLRNLRSTIPRMVQPFAGPSYPPRMYMLAPGLSSKIEIHFLLLTYNVAEILYNTCRSSVNAAMNEVKEFKQLMTSSDTQNDFEHAEQSRQKNPTDIKPWRASDEPDWANVNS